MGDAGAYDPNVHGKVTYNIARDDPHVQPNLLFNPKCVVQSLVLVGAIITARNVPELKNFWAVLLLLVVATMNYWLNAILDLYFGCEHGEYFRTLMGNNIHTSMKKKI